MTIDGISLPLADQIANEVRRSILVGELKGGEKISASRISKELNVSATPVKEAFKMLQTEGLLVSRPRSGTTVSDFALGSLEDMAFVRSALEGVAARLASEKGTEREISELWALVERSDKAYKEECLDELTLSNTMIHRQIREMAHSIYLYNLIEQLVSFDLTIRKAALNTLEMRKAGAMEHRHIVSLISEHRGPEAEQAMIEHIRRTATEVVGDVR